MSARMNMARMAMLAVALASLAGCRQEMDKQPKYLPLERSGFFKDGRSARPLVEDTVARGYLQAGNPIYSGLRHPEEESEANTGSDAMPASDAKAADAKAADAKAAVPGYKTANPDNMARYVEQLPMPVTKALLERGQERFTIFCAVCHDARGTGHGIVVERGFTPPPSYHIERLRAAPVGYFFEVITHGYGSMPDHAAQIPPRDRWAIAAYVRTLQWSQNQPLGELPAAEQGIVRAKLAEAAKSGSEHVHP